MNKSPYPELAKCDVFDAMFSQLREDRKNGKTVKVNVDAKDEAKLAVLTACDGFVNNPQATKFGGGTSAKEIAQRFDAIIPADSGLDGLISLTFMSGFAISDLAYGANEEDSKINKMRKEVGISVDLANEAEAVLKRLRESNKVDEELYKQSTAWLDGVKEAHRKAFNAHMRLWKYGWRKAINTASHHLLGVKRARETIPLRRQRRRRISLRSCSARFLNRAKRPIRKRAVAWTTGGIVKDLEAKEALLPANFPRHPRRRRRRR